MNRDIKKTIIGMSKAFTEAATELGYNATTNVIGLNGELVIRLKPACSVRVLWLRNMTENEAIRFLKNDPELRDYIAKNFGTRRHGVS